jgi:hypothetical protein
MISPRSAPNGTGCRPGFAFGPRPAGNSGPAPRALLVPSGLSVFSDKANASVRRSPMQRDGYGMKRFFHRNVTEFYEPSPGAVGAATSGARHRLDQGRPSFRTRRAAPPRQRQERMDVTYRDPMQTDTTYRFGMFFGLHGTWSALRRAYPCEAARPTSASRHFSGASRPRGVGRLAVRPARRATHGAPGAGDPGAQSGNHE